MIDQLIVGLYLIITLILGLYVGRNTSSLEDYAIGARNFSTLALVSTIFASVVDAGLTTGLVSSIFATGPIFLLSFLGIIISNFGISFLIAPKMKPFLGLISSGDIFQKLYGKHAKILMGVSTIIESTLTSAIQMLAISQMCKYFFGVPPLLASILVSLIMVLYTFRGGIKSVTAADVFQFGIMIVAIPIMCSIALVKAGGLFNVVDFLSTNGLFFKTKQEQSLLEHVAVFLSFSLPCLYPLCIQRMLMAKNTKQISSSFFINGIISLPFYLTIGVIGIVGYMLYPYADGNEVFSIMVNEILPYGAKGFVLAGMIAIFMSTVDSILNIGSLAIIHDVLGSLSKKTLEAKNEVKLMRFASFAIALGAIIICHLFSSVMDILFFLMVLGNSVFFPGFFWGILGFRASSLGFWVGVLASLSTVFISMTFFNIFPLIIMLIAISINSFILLMDYFLEKPIQDLWQGRIFKEEYKFTIKNIRRFSFFNNDMLSQEYYTIFFICAVVISLFPFFFSAAIGLSNFDFTIQILSLIGSIISFFMIFREQWWNRVDKLFPIIWIISVTLVLPAQSFYMFLISKFSFVWLLDCLLVLPLLYLLNSYNAFFVSIILGALVSLFLYFINQTELSLKVTLDFGYWALVLHAFVLTICLALFRRKDKEKYNSTQKILAHEAGRSFSSFEETATYLNNILPVLVDNFKKHHPDEAKKMDLDNILSLPLHLQNTAIRSRYIVKKLTFFSSYNQNNHKIFNILDSVNDAINDPSIKHKITGKYEMSSEGKLMIKADQAQITQVFINILENALHAISDVLEGKIFIIIEENKIIIKDTGVGIKKSDLPSIFDEGFSLKQSTGQGLAFCQKIINNQGGNITCNSKEGSFTEFIITFPKIKNG